MFQALGRSYGGFSSKIHAKVDDLGRPLEFILTPGQVEETNLAEALIVRELSHYLYDKTAVMFMGALILTGILTWLKL